MLVVLALVLGLLAAPLAVDGEEPQKVRQIGYLGSTSRGASIAPDTALGAFLEELRRLGWVEGQNIAIAYRWAEGRVDRLPALAAELVGLKVEVLLAETTPATRAAIDVTRTIPVVFTSVSDPVGSGIVASLARPGGNVTGVSNIFPEIAGKLLELLREAVPGVSRVAVLWNPANPAKELEFQELRVAARSLGVTLHAQEVRGSGDLEPAFSAMARERVAAAIVLADALTVAFRDRIADLAVKRRLPTVFNFTAHVEAGGLMAYSPSYPAMYRRAAAQVDKILRGARPADVPVEQPMTFELTINLRTAKALGLTFPRTLLLRADRIIE